MDERYQWSLTGVDLFTRLAGRPEEEHLYFLIDAINVKFYDALAAVPGTPAKHAHFIQSRETLNDAATKPFFKPNPIHTTVMLDQIVDVAPNAIVYKPMTATTATTNELFNSVYTVRLQSIVRTHEGIQSIQTSFLHPGNPEYSVISTKDPLEDMHPNSVNTILLELAKAFSLYRQNPTSEKHRAVLHKLLQQKRAGDWLQVLSCLDIGRYPSIPVGSMIYFCTEDIIAAAYALAVGTNVIFTYLGADKHYCIAVFRRNLTPPSQEDRLASFKASLQAGLARKLHGMTVEECYAEYMKFRNDAIHATRESIRGAIAAFSPESLQMPRARILPSEFKEGVDTTLREIIREFTYLLAVEYAFPRLDLPPTDFRNVLEDFVANGSLETPREDVTAALNSYTSIADTLDYIASVRQRNTAVVTDKPSFEAHLEAFMTSVLITQQSNESVKEFSIFTAEGRVVSYMSPKGSLAPLFQSVVEIHGNPHHAILHEFLEKLKILDRGLRETHASSADVRRSRQFIDSLGNILGAAYRAPIHEGELLHAIQAIDQAQIEAAEALLAVAGQRGGGVDVFKSSFLALHRLIAGMKLRSITAGFENTTRRNRNTSRNARPSTSSNPTTTVWFFYRYLLFGLETAADPSSYRTLLQFMELWMQKSMSPDKRKAYIGVLEAIILGVFPHYSTYASVLNLQVPPDVEEIASAFSIKFLGRVFTGEFSRVVDNPDAWKRGLAHTKEFTDEEFYKTYETMIERVFPLAMAPAPVASLANLKHFTQRANKRPANRREPQTRRRKYTRGENNAEPNVMPVENE